jgi:hypothetical protein
VRQPAAKTRDTLARAMAAKKRTKTAKKAAPRTSSKKISARKAGMTVDDYVTRLTGWKREVATALRKIIRTAAPKATESIKWAQPVYEHNGPFAYIKAFATGINFGFWRGAELPDPKGALKGGGDRMRHVKLFGTADVNPKVLADLVRAAVKLNEQRGDPTKR